MGRSLGHFRILLSARVIFDLEAADRVFATDGPAAYADYMCGRGAWAADFDPDYGGRKLATGPLWHLLQALLRINEIRPGTVEVVMICKDTAETAVPIFRNLDVRKCPLSMRIVTNGKPLQPVHLRLADFDLFLTRSEADAQMAVDHGVAAAALRFPPGVEYKAAAKGPVHLCVDGDAVAVGGSSELTYKRKGIEAYYKHEFNHFSKEIEPGPFTQALVKISDLNRGFAPGEEPIVLSLLTARDRAAGARLLNTVSRLGINFTGGMFLVSATDKSQSLQALCPDIFFDDQLTHLEKASFVCPSARVPYPTGSGMHKWLTAQEKKSSPKKPPPKKTYGGAGQ